MLWRILESAEGQRVGCEIDLSQVGSVLVSGILFLKVRTLHLWVRTPDIFSKQAQKSNTSSIRRFISFYAVQAICSARSGLFASLSKNWEATDKKGLHV